MASFKELFPSTTSLLTYIEVDSGKVRVEWDNDDFFKFLDVFLYDHVIYLRNNHSENKFYKITESIIDDLNKNILFLEKESQINCYYFKLLIITTIIEYNNNKGYLHRNLIWFKKAITNVDFIDNEEELSISFDFLKIESVRLNYVKENFFEILCLFFGQLYYYSRKTGGLEDICKDLFNVSKTILSFELFDEKSFFSVRLTGLAQLISWSEIYDYENQEIIDFLENYFLNKDDQLVKRQIAIILALVNKNKTKNPSSFYAINIINSKEYPPIGHEMLQMLGVCFADPEFDFHIVYPLVPKAISIYNQSLKAKKNNDFLLKFERAKIFDVFTPILINLLENQKNELLLQFLTQYFDIKPNRRRKKEVIFCLLNYRHGLLYSRGNNIHIIKHSEHVIAQVVESENSFLGITLVPLGSKDFKPIKPTRENVPNEEYGYMFEDLLQKFYKTEVIIDCMNNDAGLVIVPSIQHPIQPLMIKNIGKSLPIVTSFQEPCKDRAIRKILVWAYGIITSEIEIEVICNVLNYNNIEVDLVANDECNKTLFLEKYKSNEYDIIWVSAHGEFNHLEPENAKIQVSNEEVNISELFHIKLDISKRRLLFLNICDGATITTLHNSINDIGIGASLTSNNQAVISHMWPVHYSVSLLFGILFSFNISEKIPFFAVYENTIKSMQKGKNHFLNLMKKQNISKVAIERFEHSNIDYSNIMYWGTPTFYE